MEKKNGIQGYVQPNNFKVVWVLTLKNFIFSVEDGMIADTNYVLEGRDLAEQTGQENKTQKNRMWGQIVMQNRDHDCPELCPVELVIDIVVLAKQLGAKDPDDLWCLF